MSDQLPPNVFRRRGHRALRRMTARKRAIFWAMRLEETNFPELAERHGMSAGEVEAEFATALKIFLRTLREPDPLWPR